MTAGWGYCNLGAGSIMRVRKLNKGDKLRVKRLGGGSTREIVKSSGFVGFKI